MNLRIVEDAATEQALRAYEEITIGFTATSRLRLDLLDGGLEGVRFVEEPLAPR